MILKNLDKKLEAFNLFEFIGVYLGDGSIIYNSAKRVYKFELTGNADDEFFYFDKISYFLKDEFGIIPKVFVKYEKLGKSLKLIVDNKRFVSFLIKDLGLNFKNKAFKARIPEKFVEWERSKHVIRGIFETDGSLYFSRTKPTNNANYPRLEIKTSSIQLATQIKTILSKQGFRVNFRTSKTDLAIGVYLSGNKMLEKWVKEIGFSKIKTISKHQIYKRWGVYIPKSTLKERLNLLSGGGQAAKLSLDF